MLSFSLLSRLGFPIFLLVGSFGTPVLEADPIVLEATTLSSGGCGARVSGDNFVFDGIFTQLGNGCGGRIMNVGIDNWPVPGTQTYFNPPVTGTITGPGIPDRLAIAYGGGQPSLYKDAYPNYLPINLYGTFAVPVVLSGTLNVCLEPAGVQTPGQVVACDPAYANFAIININVAGVALFSVTDGVIGARDFLGYEGTLAAAPEPSQLATVGGITMLLWGTIAQRNRAVALRKLTRAS